MKSALTRADRISDCMARVLVLSEAGISVQCFVEGTPPRTYYTIYTDPRDHWNAYHALKSKGIRP